MGYNIGPTIAVKGESDFNKSMVQIKANMKLVSSEASLMAAQFGKNNTSTEALSAKGKTLSDALKVQKQAVKEAEDALKRMKDAGVKPTDDAWIAMETNLNNAKASMASTTNEIKENEQALKRGDKQTKDFSESWKKFATQAATGAAAALKGLAIGVGAIATAAVIAAKKIYDLTTSAGKWADELITLSNQTDVSTQTLQEWTYAARFVDTSVEDMTKGMSRVVMAMRESTEKGEDYIQVAGGIKIAMKDQSGQMKSTEQVFYDTIDALGAIEDATMRDIAAQDIFGKSYQNIKPLIDAGSESLLRYAAEAHNAGIILSDEAVTALGAFDDQMQRMNARMETAGRLAAVIFLPAISGIVGGVTDIMSAITTALSDGFQEGDVAAISNAITEQITAAMDYVAKNAPAFIGVVTNVLNSLIGMIVEMIPVILPTLVGAVLSLLTGLFQVLQQNAAPIADAAVQIVTMLILFLTENIPMIIETGMTILLAVSEGILGSLPELIPAIIQMITEIALTLTNPETLAQLVVASAQIIFAVITGLVDAIPQLVETAAQIVVNLALAFAEAAPQLWENGKEFIIQLGEGIWAQLSALFIVIGTWITTNIVQPVKDKIAEFREIGRNVIMGIWNGIGDKIGWLKDQIRGVVDKIKSWFTGKDGFDENSPSKWGEGVGEYLMAGVGIGVGNGVKNALSATSNAINLVKRAMSVGTSADVSASGYSQGGAAGGTFAPVFNIYAKDKDTALEAADATVAALQRARWQTV